MTQASTIASKDYKLVMEGLRYDRYALIVITLMSVFTISSSAVVIADIPRMTIISVIFTVYLIFKLRAKLARRYGQFVIVYLVAFIPGTIFALNQDGVKLASAVQLCAGLVTFVVLATYFHWWLAGESDLSKERMLKWLLLIFFAFSVVEILLYEQFSNLRTMLYHSRFTESVAPIYLQRELTLYGGRPTALFSETSNFAKYIGIMIAAYMTVTRCSWRSFLALVVFMLALRSVSIFYAAPAMALALLKPLPGGRSIFSYLSRRMRANVVVLMLVGGVAAVGIVYTQSERIDKALTRGDGSLNARILYPAEYMAWQSPSPIIGMGLTPQDEVQEFTQQLQVIRQRMVLVDGFNEGISTSIVTLIGLGAVGFMIFCFGMYVLQGMQGLVLWSGYLAANLINSGYNSVSTFVPSALLLALMVYQLNAGRGDQKSARVMPNRPQIGRRFLNRAA